MAGKTSKSQEGYYAKYKSGKTWEKNRIARLERTLRAQPTNQQVIDALKGGLVYRRKTPTTSTWSAGWVRVAKIFKTFEGRFDRGIMSANPETVRTALQRQSVVSAEILRSKKEVAARDTKSFFSLEARLQGIR